MDTESAANDKLLYVVAYMSGSHMDLDPIFGPFDSDHEAMRFADSLMTTEIRCDLKLSNSMAMGDVESYLENSRKARGWHAKPIFPSSASYLKLNPAHVKAVGILDHDAFERTIKWYSKIKWRVRKDLDGK